MEALIIAIIVGVAVYGLYSVMFVGKYATGGDHTRQALGQIYEENKTVNRSQTEIDETMEILKADIDDSFALKLLSVMPFGKNACVNIVKAGMQHKAGVLMLFVVALIVIGMVLVTKQQANPVLYLVAIALPLYIGHRIVQGRIKKRNEQFINMFPDVLDMIVRSVRSGFPLNTAISMVADNMEPPVSTEFRQVADEVALGRSLSESLERLAVRIPEQDVRFFVVVLKIQQETGGNLAEVITNLSNVIRKRKQLRRKIKAMTAEGRVTGYILGAIPIVMFIALYFASPGHLDPLFDTSTGNIILGISIGLIIVAQLIVHKMIDIDI